MMRTIRIHGSKIKMIVSSAMLLMIVFAIRRPNGKLKEITLKNWRRKMTDHFVCADCDTVCATEYRYEDSAICLDCTTHEYFTIDGAR